MKNTPKKRKSRLVETEDGRLLIKSPMAYVYLLLPMAFLCLFVLFPTVMAGRMAFFQKYNFMKSLGTGFGTNAFEYVLHDKVFWQAAKNTGILMVVALPATVVLSLMFALLINAIKRLKGMFQALFVLPYVTSSIAIGAAFQWLFHS